MNDNDLDERITQIRAQETHLVLPQFAFEDAWAIGTRLVTLANERALAITIRIVRGEQVLFHAALPGTSLDNNLWAQRKARTVARFGRSSYLVGLEHKRSGTDFLAQPWNDGALYAAHGGSFPATVAGTGVVG